MPILEEVRLKSGEPDAGEPPVRFGGRGPQTNAVFLPLSSAGAVRHRPQDFWGLQACKAGAKSLCRPFRAKLLIVSHSGSGKPRQRMCRPYGPKNRNTCQRGMRNFKKRQPGHTVQTGTNKATWQPLPSEDSSLKRPPHMRALCCRLCNPKWPSGAGRVASNPTP